jgi:hypothetical protein
VKRRKAKRPPLKFEQIDSRCRADILRAARGEPSAWPADNYSTQGTHQERFDRGDKQMVLWAIVLAAIDGKQIPKWAAHALEKAMIIMSAGADWTDVFGRERAERGKNTGANRDSIRRRAENMYRVWDYIEQRKAPRKFRTLRDAAADELGISRTLVERYYRRMERFYK